jgi:hypothetical protein
MVIQNMHKQMDQEVRQQNMNFDLEENQDAN